MRAVTVARAFRVSSGGVVRGRLDPHEVELLRELVAELIARLAADLPNDAVTRRLFPDGYADPTAAAELRGLIQDDLREAKLAAARGLLAALPDDGRLALDRPAAEHWMTALNDLRLTLGTAIGVTEEMSEREPGDDPSFQLYDWLTFLQETLVLAVLARGIER